MRGLWAIRLAAASVGAFALGSLIAEGVVAAWPTWRSSGPAAPVCTAYTSTGNSGGNSTFSCTGLVTSPLPRVLVCAEPCGMSGGGTWNAVSPVVTSATSTSMQVTLPPTTCTAGTSCQYAVQVTNAGSSTPFSDRGVPLVFGENTPLTCVASVTPTGWYRGDSDVNTGCGSNVTSATDKTSSGNTMSSFSGLVHTCANGTFDNEPFWTCNGSSSYGLVPTFTNGTHTLWCAIAMKLLAAGSNPAVLATGYHSFQGSASTGEMEVSANGTALWPTSVVNTAVAFSLYNQGTGSSSQNLGIAVDGQAYVTATGAATELPTSFPLAICANTSTTGSITGQYANVAIADLACFSGVPTTAEKSCIAQYENERYQLSSPPSFTSATPLWYQASGGEQSGYVQGANFVSGITFDIEDFFGNSIIGGFQSATYISSSLLTIALPSGSYTPGSYTLVLKNPDNGESTADNAISITSTASPLAVMGAQIAWASYGSASFAAGSIKDLSQGLTATTVGSLTYSSSDSAFSSQPSIGGFSSSNCAYSPITMPASNDVVYDVVTIITTGASFGAWGDYVDSPDEIRFDQNGVSIPNVRTNVTATWGSSLLTTKAYGIYGYMHYATLTTGISVDYASEVTATSTNELLNANGTLTIGARTSSCTNNFTGRFGYVGAYRKIPTTAEATNICNWKATTLGTSSANCASPPAH